uniref:Uncharacterized protein LOC123614791 n=1 Tax=Camelus bactrianus TaxID=9837 RepID=A0A9W3FV26_CAMBA|nr:uncharacterized protein LOC123614791 [Camelus bactrianus]
MGSGINEIEATDDLQCFLVHKRSRTTVADLPTNTGLPAHTGLLSTLPATPGHGLREDSRQARRSSGKDGAEPGARWKGGAACTSSRASTGLLGNIVLCRESRLRLLEGGLQFPSVLGSLCAARLRSLATNAAIKACFAPGLMLASVVEWPTRPSWSWGTGYLSQTSERQEVKLSLCWKPISVEEFESFLFRGFKFSSGTKSL